MDLYVILNLMIGDFIKIPTKTTEIKLKFIFLGIILIFVLTPIGWNPELKCFKKLTTNNAQVKM